MTLAGLAARNLMRNKFRTSLTILGAALAVASFIIIRTVVDSYTSGASLAAKDRVVTRHKVTFIMPLPRRYVDEVAQVKNIKAVTFASWFGARDPKDEKDFFATMAIDSKTFTQVYYDFYIAPDVMQRFLEDKKGAVIGEALAKKKGWKVGDTVHLSGTIYPGDWEFRIAGLYEPKNKSFDRLSLFFHWEYLNDALKGKLKDQVGWIVALMDKGTSPAEAGTLIDKRFDDGDIQTLSQDEQAFNRSFLGMFSTILTVLNAASIIIICVLVLIIGNTIAMGVRERTNEYGVLRAIGFLPVHLVSLVVSESLVLGVAAGGVGLLLGYGAMAGLGRFIEENMGQILPVVVIENSTVMMAMVIALVLAVAASILPARRAFLLNVLNALRRIG